MNFFDMLVSKSINGGGGGSGTSNYNELSNKPSINNVTLTGNKTASALGLQPEITGDVKISSDNVDDTGATNLFVTSDEKSTWSGKQDALTFDDAPTENSNNPVKSGGIYTALSGKQATLTFDDTPTSGSSNPVKSGGVYTALGNKQDTVTFDGTYSASTNKAATVSTVTNAVNALDVTGGSVAASKTLASWSETNGKVSVTTQDIAITGSQAVLTGYSIAQSKQSIAATDTATEAFGKVEQRVQTNENNISTLQTSLAVGSSDNAKVLTAIYEGGEGSYAWVTPSGGGGTTNYNDLSNKPQIEGITLTGNKSLSDLGIAPASAVTLVSGLNTTGTIKNGSSETSTTGYTASPIISGVPYYKDTTYESKSAVSGGAAVSLCTTGEKYTWNNKQAALTTTQLAAVNSGIDSTKVAQIATNEDNISMLESMNGAKNFAQLTYTGSTVNGVTYTVSNGIITADGNTTTNSGTNIIITGEIPLAAGNYVLLDGLAASSDLINLTLRINNVWKGTTARGGIYEFAIVQGETAHIELIVAKNTSTADVVFKPMIISKSAYDAGFTDFQTYAMSNAELTAAIQALQAQLANQ